MVEICCYKSYFIILLYFPYTTWFPSLFWVNYGWQFLIGKSNLQLKAIGGSGVKNWCLVIFKDFNEPESLIFTEYQNSISFKSYYNVNFGNLARSLINFADKNKILGHLMQNHSRPSILIQNGWIFYQMTRTCRGTKLRCIFGKFWIFYIFFMVLWFFDFFRPIFRLKWT